MTAAHTREAWALLGAESKLWCMAPERLSALAAEISALPPAHSDFWFASPPQRSIAAARRHASPPVPASTAIVPIVGPLVRRGTLATLFGLTSYDGIRAAIAGAVADSSVDRILLWVDSPGGSASGCDECHEAIRAAAKRKPITAYVDGLCASAALWLASGAQRITASKSSEIGSLGVFALHVDESAMLADIGVKPSFVVSKVSPFKVETNPLQPLAADARAYLQQQIDHLADRFVTAVARGRSVAKSRAISDFGGGRVMFADAAKRVGLIDDIETIDDALAAAPTSPVAARAAKLAALAAPTSREQAAIRRRQRLEILRG